MTRRFHTSLYFWVLVAIALGIVLGVVIPDTAARLEPLGTGFIKLVKMTIAPLIFCTVVVGIAGMKSKQEVGKAGGLALLYFELASTVALVIGLVIVNLVAPGSGMHADPAQLDTSAVDKALATAGKPRSTVEFLLDIIPDSFFGALARGELLPVLLVAILFGFALQACGERGNPVTDLLDRVSQAIFGVVAIIMKLAPIGAFGAMAFTIGKYGLGTLWQLGQLIAGVYLVSIVFVIVVLGAALRLAGFPLWKTLRYFADEILIVFGATSAETMIPRLMIKLERLGCAREVVGLVIPTGYSFNMDATSIYMTMAVMFIAQAANIDLSWTQQLTILFVMLFTSKGAAGVTGGGFIALAATMPAIGVLPIGGLALLLGIDRFMAQIRAAVNLTGNAIATVVIARWCGAIDVDRAHAVLDGMLEGEESGA